jgi:two-component system, sensor histidine kinase and response regulator
MLPGGPQASGANGRPRLHVLVAEDNALNQIVSKAVLEHLGHEVTVANDGAEALGEVSARPSGHFGMVLMDLHMPVMDGLEATRRIRALPQGAALPILALTAAALQEDRDRCLAAGMDGHITKPLEAEQLVAAMSAFDRLQGGNGSTPGARAHNPPADDEPAWARDLPALPGFDLKPLLGRVRHNERLVWSLLEDFVKQEGVTAQELEGLLRAQRFDEARLRTHSLMGSAAAVGAHAGGPVQCGPERGPALGHGEREGRCRRCRRWPKRCARASAACSRRWRIDATTDRCWWRRGGHALA